MTDAGLFERATYADRQYLRRPGPADPWVPSLEMELTDAGDPIAVEAALTRAVAAEPRFTAVPVGTRSGVCWRITRAVPKVDLDGGADDDAWRSSSVDRAFAEGEHPLRVSMRGGRLLFSWRHAVSDAAGCVGFCSLVARALAGVPLPQSHSAKERGIVGREIWRQAVRPAALVSFARKARSFERGLHAELGTTGAIGPSSTSRVAVLKSGEHVRGQTFTGRVVAAAAGACAGMMPSGVPVTLLLPINLRPGERWFPAGNFVGNVELVFDEPPTAEEASTDVERSRGPERYSAWLASAVREALPGGLGRRGEAEGGRLERSAVVNNLGQVDAALFPGCETLVFHGPTAVDFPSISFVGLGGRTAVCVRVRDHQGGAEVAAALLAGVVDRLSVRDG